MMQFDAHAMNYEQGFAPKVVHVCHGVDLRHYTSMQYVFEGLGDHIWVTLDSLNNEASTGRCILWSHSLRVASHLLAPMQPRRISRPKACKLLLTSQ